jgi:hypothetical protein
MIDPILAFIVAVFLLAGFVKGVIGLGLPPVSMGLLAIAMPPTHALAIVIVPAILTNLWQTFIGPHLRDIMRRLWPLLLGLAVGTRLNAGMMTGPYARYAPDFPRHSAGDLCRRQLAEIHLQRQPAERKMGRRHCRADQRRHFSRNWRAGHSVDAILAGHRDGKG